LHKVAIPSYSEVLFLREAPPLVLRGETPSRNPFLFRGPIPTDSEVGQKGFEKCRNPFLFRGPIPTQLLLYN